MSVPRMSRAVVIVLAGVMAFASRAAAGVIVVANYTPEAVTLEVAEPGEKARTHSIPAYNVLPITVTGPADLKLPGDGKNNAVRVDPANAYVLIPDRVQRVRIEGIQLPGQPPERDARPELNPVPRKPVKIPVTLLVDDVDPRADQLWHKETRDRFDAAAAVIEAQTGFRFEFAGFDTWKSDPAANDLLSQLAAFEDSVKVKTRGLAVGFTSRKLDDAEKEFGACRGLGASHVLIREWKPKGEPERMEVLLRYLAVSLGAVTSPDPGSAMRPQLGDGRALHTGFVVRLDPLNVLALNLLADQRRQGVNSFEAIPQADRIRLTRVYSALAQAVPGDGLALDYLTTLDKDVAKAPGPGVRKPVPVGDRARQTEGVRTVVRAIVERAKANTGPTALRGDDLTVALITAAASAAQRLDESDRVTCLLLGIGVGLDDRNTLCEEPLTAGAVANIETDAERAERISRLDNPTIRGRRDLCRAFAVGCGLGELLTASAAETVAVGHAAFDLIRPNYPAGFSFPALAAELSGIAFARSLRDRPDADFPRLREKVSVAEFVPDLRKLPDCLGPEKFAEAYGEPGDDRFRAVVAEIRKRIESLPVNK